MAHQHHRSGKASMSRTLLAVGAGMASVIPSAAAQASGEFSALAMNVAGLPAFLNPNDVPGDKATNHRSIGAKFVELGYDVINVQEDFNYHAALYETATLPHRTPTSGGVPFGSGLNTLALHPFLDQTRVKWDDCSNDSGADCLTPKGFTLVRVALSTGAEGAAYVDVYNIHADAGSLDRDLEARRNNLHQLSRYIDTWSDGNAVVVAGDTNSRYTRLPDDIRVFGRENGLKDPWVELVRDGVEPAEETICSNPSTTNYCETVDKIFYRGGPLLDVQATHWSYESARFLQGNGDVLSDHNPVFASFSWNLRSDLRQSEMSLGGPHGTWFSDAESLAGLSSRRARTLRFRGGSRLDGVELVLSDGATFSHGGTGGSVSELVLADGEAWTEATLCQGQRSGRTRIFYIEAVTSQGRRVASGAQTSECSTFAAPSGWGIVGSLGRDVDEIDRLGFIYAQQ